MGTKRWIYPTGAEAGAGDGLGSRSR